MSQNPHGQHHHELSSLQYFLPGDFFLLIHDTITKEHNYCYKRGHKNNYLTAIHVIMRYRDLQLWIMVSGGWF